MPTPSYSDFLAFAIASGANVMPQSQWAADPVVANGFDPGILQGMKLNKAIRQASFVAAGVAEMMMNTLAVDIQDDGDLANFVNLLTRAVTALGTAGITVSAGLTATGVDQASALALAAQFNEVVVCPAGAGVMLPSYMTTPGGRCTVAAYGSSNPLLVYPQSGQTIFASGVTLPVNGPYQASFGSVTQYQSATPTAVYLIS